MAPITRNNMRTIWATVEACREAGWSGGDVEMWLYEAAADTVAGSTASLQS